jgi:cation-transporting ATPase 13A3/4/5
MDDHDDAVHGDRDQTPETGHGRGFYRLGTNQSNASVFEDVEMAHDEVG